LNKIKFGILSGLITSVLVVVPSFAADLTALQGSTLDLSGTTTSDTLITFVDRGVDFTQSGSSFYINTDGNLKLQAAKGKSVVVDHNNLAFSGNDTYVSKFGDPKIDFNRGGSIITAEGDSLNMETDGTVKIIGDTVRIDHNYLKFVSDTRYPIPTIDFIKEGAKITAEDGVKIEGDKGLEIAGPIKVTGAQTLTGNQTVTGNLTVTGTADVQGALTLGDGGDTAVINTSDWGISATGAMTGIGAITADGLITGTLGATISGAVASINASSNFATNINTGTSTGTVTIGGSGAKTIHIAGTGATAADTVNIGTGGTAADTINIGTGGVAGDTVTIGTATAENVSITDNNWNVTAAGLANFVSVGAATPGTGVFTTLTASTAVIIPNGADPGATCTVGQIYLDTDQTVDTNCATTADNSLCVCTATNTWTAFENN